ncbi:MAG: NupC/NupG family nucleoside CNT transporter, partial [Selenomonas sp.]|nr:NupC/NupG family nucleoside CNT transporter [Selenomonas sp.]
MFFFVNLLGLVVFLGIGVLASRNRKEIQWRSVASLLTLNLVLAWFLTSFEIGRDMITAAASGFTELINISYVGIAFVFPDWVNVPQMNFFAAGLLPILFVVPLFDILTYFGILPFIIRWVGKLLTFLTRAPKFESFFAIEMMFLGNTEALAVSKLQLMRMSKERVLTIGLMSMSCVTAALIAVYVKMMPAEYVVTAIPLNVINALLVSSILHPVKVAPEEDTIATLSEGG